MTDTAAARRISDSEYVRRVRRRGRTQHIVERLVIHLILIVGGALVLVPFFTMITTSLKQEYEAFAIPPQWIPSKFMWSNYTEALFDYFQWDLFGRNTMIISIGVLVGRLLTASMVAYGFARVRFVGRDIIFLLVLGTMMIPGQVTIVPLYIIYRDLHWLNTFLPLIVPAWLGGGAFYIFLLRQFIMTIGPELDDAARIDGCGSFGIYWRIILPLIKPALGAVAIFSFLSTWNDFWGPLVFLRSKKLITLALGLHIVSSQPTGASRPSTTIIMAGSTLLMIPPLLLFFFAQRYFIQGVVFTGVKG